MNAPRRAPWTVLVALLFAAQALFAPDAALAQTASVSGTVTDAGSGTPLPGVNVAVEGTTIGTATDAEGRYELEMPPDQRTLVFTFIGYQTRTVQVAEGQRQVDVALQEDVVGLDEVVVTGLASSVKRSNLANSVATVSAAELTGITTSQTIDGALSGKVAGAEIRSYTGAPGGGLSVKLRGISTINGNSQPLYVVDGVIMDNSAIQSNVNAVTQAASGGNRELQDNPVNRIADLNPEDIESVEILKGASAAAIYGGRASNGVVIITTKRGRAGETRVGFSQTLGVTRMRNPLGMRQFTAETAEEAFGERGLAEFQAAQSGRGFIDYEEEIFGNTGLLSTTSLSVSGGNETTQFFVSGLLKDDEGIVERTGYEKRSVRANLDHRITDRARLSFTSNYINAQTRRGLTGNDNSGTTFGIALVATPNFIDIRPDANGNYPDHPFNTSNPLQTIALFTNEETVNRVVSSARFSYDLLSTANQSLRFVTEGGVDSYNLETVALFPRDLQFEQTSPQPGTSVLTEANTLNVNLRGLLVHTYNVADRNLSFSTQAGLTGVNFDQNQANVVANNLLTGQQNINQAGALTPNQQRVIQRDRSFFAQEEANWDDKVIATAGVRGDRSSVNGDVDRFYIYPKASLAVNVANFGFWNVEAVNQLKLRGAFGQTGNVATFGSKFTSFAPTSISGNIGALIGTQRGFADIEPERQTEFEGGVDLGLYDGRLNLELTAYYKRISDQLLLREVPGSTGFNVETINGGVLVNRGFEAGLTALPVNRQAFRWRSRTNFWTNRAEVVELPVPAFRAVGGGFGATLGEVRIEEGESPTQIVGIDDRDGDGTSDGVFKLGDAAPDFQVSFLNDVTFLQDFTLSVLAHWKKGGQNLNLTELLYDLSRTSPDFDDDDDGDGTSNGNERLAQLGVSATPFVQDASYFRIREIGLYYALPDALLAGTFGGVVRGVRLGISANNLLTITPYKSYDPEVNNFGTQPVATGVEVSPYPSSRQFMFHIRVDL